jgi:tetratricopeptide (TPR) repeat protein
MKSLLQLLSALFILLLLFVGCGNESGEKEYRNALQSLEKNDLIRARTLLEKSLRETISIPEKIERSNQLGLILWELNEPQLAAQQFQQAISLGANSEDLLLNLAIALLSANQLEEANLLLQNLLNQQPENPTYLALTGLLNLKNNQLPLAQKHLQQAQQKATDQSPALLTALPLARLNAGENPVNVRQQLQAILQAHPNYAPLHYNLAILNLHQLKDLRAAQKNLTTFCQLQTHSTPRRQEAEQLLQQIQLQMQQPDNQPDPAQARTFTQSGTKAFNRQAYAEAIDLFRQAIQLDPSQADAHYNLSLAHYHLNSFEATINACQSTLNLDKTFINARYMLALAHYRLGNLDEAEQQTQQLQEQNDPRASVLLSHIETARQR